MKSPTPLSKALMLHFVLVAVIPILLLGIFGLRYFQQKHIETISRLLDTHALNVSAEATGFLDETNATLALIAAMIGTEELHGREKIDQSSADLN